jgi:hypothetical protein
MAGAASGGLGLGLSFALVLGTAVGVPLVIGSAIVNSRPRKKKAVRRRPRR